MVSIMRASMQAINEWNEVIFQSLQSGNLKQLDLEFYLRLRLPTTKRMFRFLDKRFYRRNQLDFDFRVLACGHIGLIGYSLNLFIWRI
jgi:hypothetical protein